MNTSQDNSQNDAKDSILARTPEQETRGSRDMAEHLGENPSSDTHKIKLNLPCQICNKDLILGQAIVTFGDKSKSPAHLSCIKKETLDKVRKIIKDFPNQNCGWVDDSCPMIDRDDLIKSLEQKA